MFLIFAKWPYHTFNLYNKETRNHPDTNDACLIPCLIHIYQCLKHSFIPSVSFYIYLYHFCPVAIFFTPKDFYISHFTDLSLSLLFFIYNISFPYSSQCYFKNANQNHILFQFKIIHISILKLYLTFFLMLTQGYFSEIDF